MGLSRLSVAMHEAGHAVIQLANPPSPWINSIVMGPLPDGVLGRVNTRSMWEPYMATAAAPDIIAQWRELAWKDIIFTLAGPIAELRWQRNPRWAVQWAAGEMGEHCLGEALPVAGSDFDQVRRRVQWLCPDQQERAFILAWIETEKQVAQHLAGIIALGRFLSEQSDLSDVALLEFWRSHTAAPSTARCKRLSLSTLMDALNDG